MAMEIGTFEAKNRLSELLDRVAEGEEVVITRRGRPAARLVPAKPAHDREAGHRALDELIELSKGTSLGGLAIRELKEFGRP